MTTTPRTCVELLRSLHATCNGVTELRTFRPGDSGPPFGRAFLKSDDVNSLTFFIGSHLDEHNYFGVATRRDGSSGTLANCLELPALFVDIDFKCMPEISARQRLAECPFAPSAVVSSGGGLHVYWLLNEPLNLQAPPDCVRARVLLQRLAHFLDADLQAAEPARVLRLPGTQNFKYTPPRQACVEMLEPARRYHASEFDDLLPAEPVEVHRTAFVAPEKILDGQRNGTLFKEARSLKAKHFSREAICASLHAENRAKCEPPLPDGEVEDIVESAWSQADRPEFTHRQFFAENISAPHTDTPPPGPSPQPDEAPELPVPLGQGLGSFLGLDFPLTVPLIEGLLSNDGGGWISGEEKLGKSYYALEEALCLALGLPVCGVFAVHTRMRVMFIEEEDPPSRLSRRVKQLLRGHGLDPDDHAVRTDLDQWFQISVWNGFTLDETSQVGRLAHTLTAFQPTVVYLDVLRKLTTKDLNKGDQAGTLLKILDDLRREFHVLFRVVAHNRKIQGSFRAGRGSQEIAGSYQLGAWGENSLFFEPIGKTGKVKVQAQRKDGAPTPAFGLRFEAEGLEDNPTLVRLHAEELSTSSAADLIKEQVYEAIGSLPPEEALVSGDPGVSVAAIMTVVHKSDRPVRNAVTALIDDGRCLVTGRTTKQKKLYAQITL